MTQPSRPQDREFPAFGAPSNASLALSACGLLSSAFVLGMGLEVGLGVIATGVAVAGVIGAWSLLRGGASRGKAVARDSRTPRSAAATVAGSWPKPANSCSASMMRWAISP